MMAAAETGPIELKNNDVDDPMSLESVVSDHRYMINPWHVQSLEEYLFYWCPECDSKCQTKELFVSHAIFEHPYALATLSQSVDLEKYLVPSEDIDEKSDGGSVSSVSDIEWSGDENNDDHEEQNDDDIPDVEEGDIFGAEPLEPPAKKRKYNFKSKIPFKADDNSILPPQAEKSFISTGKPCYQCYVCGDMYSSKIKAFKHVKSSHAGRISQYAEGFGPVKENIRDLQCYFCGDLFTIAEIRSHIREKHKKKPNREYFGPERSAEPNVQCYYCGEMMTAQQILGHQLDNHLVRRVRHDMYGDPRPVQCPNCNATFPTEERMLGHHCHFDGFIHIQPNAEGYYQCPKCEFKAKDKRRLKNHYTPAHSERNFGCGECTYRAKTAALLKKHIQLFHRREFKVFCEYCEKGFSDNHVKSRHVNSIHLGVRDDTRAPTYTCNICDAKFPNVWQHNIHFEKDHKPSHRMFCNDCDLQIPPLWFDVHRSMDHPSDKELAKIKGGNCVECRTSSHTLTDEQPMFKCKSCDVKYCNGDALKKHVAETHKRLILLCEQCPFHTKFKSILDQHIFKWHDTQGTGIIDPGKKKPHKCDLCGLLVAKLDNHMSDMHPEHWRWCLHCKIILEGTMEYVQHMVLIHGIMEENVDLTIQSKPGPYIAREGNSEELTPEKIEETNPDGRRRRRRVREKFVPLCTICNKTLSSKQSYDQHMKNVHQKIKDYKCDLCDFTTGREGVLRRHIKSKHEQSEIFYCELCSFKSYIKGSVQSHVRYVHDKIKPFECDMCDAAYSYGRDLKKHKERLHGIFEVAVQSAPVPLL